MSNAGKKAGQHGRFGERNPVMVLSGPGIKHGITIPGAQNIDVVPTILSLLHIPPASTVEGKIITDAVVGH